jgi:hypothetical protein
MLRSSPEPSPSTQQPACKNVIQRTGSPESRAMKSRCPLCSTSLSRSVVLFVEQRLNVLEEMIAHPLERPCAGNLEQWKWRPNPSATAPLPTGSLGVHLPNRENGNSCSPRAQ